MKRFVIFQPAAKQDFLEACAWYETQRNGLGDRFEASVEQTLDVIAATPIVFPAVHRGVRRALVRPFPYGVFYRMRGGTIYVLAIMHGHRDPAAWENRADTDDAGK